MKIIESIKTVLVTVLFLGAVTMAGIYIAAQPRTAASTGDLPANVLSVLRGGTGGVDARIEQEQLLPAFLAIKEPGQSAAGLMRSAAMLRDLSETLSPWTAFAIGSGASAETISGEEAEACWQLCLASDCYFYLRWRFAVPAAVLYAHSLPERESAMLETAGRSLPRIAEIFYFPDMLESNVCAVSRDEAGEVTLWHRTRGTGDNLPEMEDFSIYLRRNVLERYTFAGRVLSDCPISLLTMPVFNDILELPELIRITPFAGTAETDRVSDSILALFSYNPNKVSSYYEADTDTAVFVETHGTLRASADSLRYEAAARGGLSVADLVRRPEAELNLRDDIIACEALVERLRKADADCVGGNAVPQLTAIGTEGDTLILTYIYTYNNIDIAEHIPALRLAVRAHRIVEVQMAVCSYRADETTSRAGSQAWMYNLAAHRAETTPEAESCIALCYTVTAEPDRLRADWQLETRTGGT